MKNQYINGYINEIIVASPKFYVNPYKLPPRPHFLSISLIPHFAFLLFTAISIAPI